MEQPSATPCFTSSSIVFTCTLSTMAPISMHLSRGLPTMSCSMRVLSLAYKVSEMLSSTSKREPAQHTWPWLNQMASTTPSTTLSRSASSKTMNGDLPPSSSETFFPVPAVARLMILPTSVEPVNAIFCTPGWFTKAAPVAPAPVMMLTTPLGKPACWQISANNRAVREVNSAGFSTTVFPIARAGAIFQESMSKGKFQGMIWPMTPISLYSFNSVSISCAQPAW